MKDISNSTSFSYQSIINYFVVGLTTLLLIIVCFLSSNWVLSNSVEAQTTTPSSSCDDITDPSSCQAVETFNAVLNFLALLVVPLCGVILIVAGIQYSTARNEPKALAEARMRIYKVVLALVMFISLWSFLKWLLPGGLLE